MRWPEPDPSPFKVGPAPAVIDSEPSTLVHNPRTSESDKRPTASLIEVKVHDINQLFNSMDPSPFHERDLDHDAEEFIVSWAQEHASHLPLRLVVHLTQRPADGDASALITESIHHYFAYKAELNWREFKLLMKEGRASLLIGLAFLAACLGMAEFFAFRPDAAWQQFFRESLTIGGWVAMWRPLEIYLYRWWPLLRLGRVYRKLSVMKIEVQSPQVPQNRN